MQNKRFLMLSTSLGSALEYYDFVIFMMFSAYIGANFFPNSSVFISRLETLSLFTVGYLARPIGGMLFGHLGDKYGRKAYFTNAIMLMALTTTCIALLPGYQTIGAFGAIILCVLRVLQGIAQGAELPGAFTFISEHSTQEKRGWHCGLVTMSVGFGASFSSLISYLLIAHLSHEHMLSFGWRLPFFLGGMIGFLGYFIRKKTQETPHFLKQQTPPKSPLIELLRNYPKQIIQGISLSLFAACFIIFALYLPTYLHEYFQYSTQSVVLAFTLSATWSSILIPIFGALSDRMGRQPLLLTTTLAVTLTLFLLFKIVSFQNTFALYSFMFTYQFIIAILAACYPAMLAELFPTNVRYSGVAFCYNTSFSLASMIPLIATSLLHMTHQPYIMVIVFMGLAIITARAAAKKNIASLQHQSDSYHAE